MKKLIPGILAILMCASCMTACDLGSFGDIFGGGENPPVVTPEDPTPGEDPGNTTTKPEGVLTWAEFTAAEKDTIVTVSGVITGLVNSGSKHEIYFQDEDGAYYAYNVAVDMSNLAVGMEISITGKRNTNYGINQVKDASNITILNETPATVQSTDITADVETAEYDFTNKELIAKYQSKLVTIKGVTILGQNATNNTYYDFAIGGSVTYARISSSTNLMNAEQTTVFETTVSENIAKVADVTGIVTTYNGQIYLIPVAGDAFNNITTPEYSDTEKVAFEESLVELSTYHFTSNVTTIALPTTGKAYKDVAITWASSDDTLAKVNADGTLTVTLSEEGEQEVTLEATLSCGEAETVTVTKTLHLEKATNYIVDDMTSMPTVGEAFKLHLSQTQLNQELYFTGEMNGYYYATTTNIEEAVDVKTELVPGTTNEYYLYVQPSRTKSYIYVYTSTKDADNDYINVNLLPVQEATDIPTHTWTWNETYNTFVTTQKFTQKSKGTTYEDFVYLGTYGTNKTISASRLSFATTSYVARPATVINGDTATTEVKLAKDAKDLTFDLDSATVAIEGTAFKSAITWASNNAAVAIAADGTLTVTKGTSAVQVTVTATLTLNGETTTKEFVVEVPADSSTPVADATLTLVEAIAWAKTFAHNTYSADKYYIVATVKNVYNTTYGNMYVEDENGNELTVYGTYSADGKTRYDAMTSKPQAGDTVKLYGVLGTYSNAAQMKNGWIIDFEHTHNYKTAKYDETYHWDECACGEKTNVIDHTLTTAVVAPTCSAKGYTSHTCECGYSYKDTYVDATGDHVFVEGTCSCGATEGAGGEVVAPAPKTVNVSIATYATENKWENSKQYLNLTMDENVSVKLAYTGSYNNTGKFYTNGNNWRIYQNESPSITISAAEGKTIVSVKVTYSVDKTGILTLNGTNVTSGTVVSVNANSVSFGVGNTGTVSNGQVRITAIEVIYE